MARIEPPNSPSTIAAPGRRFKPGNENSSAKPRAVEAESQNATSRGDSPRLPNAAVPGRDGLGDTLRRPRVAILIAEGVDSEAAETLYDGLVDSGAVPLYVGPHLGTVTSIQGVPLEAEVMLGSSPPVLFEAVVVPGGKDHVTALCDIVEALDFVKEQHRLAKPILALQEGAVLVEKAGLPAPVNPEQSERLMLVGMHATAADALPDLVEAMALDARLGTHEAE